MRQRHGQHQPPPLATRQRLNGSGRLLWLEQEILHVADDVARLTVNDHRIATPTGQGRGDARLGVEAFAPLVKGRDLKIGAELHAAGVGRKCPG